MYLQPPALTWSSVSTVAGMPAVRPAATIFASAPSMARATGGALGALTQAGIGKDEADVYAEGLRRGGAVVSARVADNDAARLQAIMDRSAVRVADRAAAYRKSGWKTFDANATPYNADQVKKERSLNM